MLPFRDINPSRTFPLVTISLIVLNALVFLYMVTLQWEGGPQALEAFVNRAAIIPREYTTGVDVGAPSLQPVWLTLFTSMFMHGGPLHLFGNMLYLWIFGNNVEDSMGSGRFVIFYLLCGVLAAGVYILTDPRSTVPVLGASGAIAGVLGAYLVRFPSARVDSCLLLPFFFTIVRLPAIIVLAFWFLLQLLSGTASLLDPAQRSNIAFWAHIGGFLAGMVLITLFARRGNSPYQGYR